MMAPLKDQIYTDSTISQILLWSFILVLICLLGDLLCSVASRSQLLWRALADNATHGAVGMAAWAVVVTPGFSVDGWVQCVLCGVLASAIDVDHFWQARSLDLKAAVSLQHRPPLHSTSLVLAIITLLWMVSLVLRLPQLRNWTLMCAVAWLTHHLRDGLRRGLWFPPFGSTPPLPYILYVTGIVWVSVLGHYGYLVCCQVLSAHERTVELVPKVVVE